MIPAAHLNETLKRMLPIMAKTTPARLAQALQTPYLTFKDPDHKGITGDELRALNLLDDFGLPRVPFPVFRFCMEDYKGRTVCGCVQRNEGEIQLAAFHKYEGSIGPVSWAITFRRWDRNGDLDYDGRLFDTRTMKDVTDFVKQVDETNSVIPNSAAGATKEQAKKIIPVIARHIKNLQQSSDILRGTASVLESVSEFAGEKSILPDAVPIGSHSVFIALYHSLMTLCYEYLAPHNFTARVTPSTQGKSVEWLRAREHYTVIHRHHAANNKAVKEGSTVTDHKHATRLAHSRRAHTKVLNHPRYKFKRGQTIFVRASWVGPKEWKDTAGQTYQILVPVAA